MTEAELLAEWQELMQRDEPLAPGDALAGLEEWDSLSQTVLAAFFDRKLGRQVSVEALAQCATVADLLRLAQNGPV